MTNPRLAQDTPQGRYYTDPAGGPALVSVTNVLDTAVAKKALIPWAVKLTTEHILDNLAEVNARFDDDRTTLTKEIKAVHREVKERAGDLGDRIHTAAEQHVLGAPVADDPEVAPYLAQLVLWLTMWNVDLDEHIEATECTVFHRRLGYAGTADLLIWLPTGPGGVMELWLIDYKTSATRSAKSVYPENTLQLAALRYAETVLLPDDTDAPMPPIARTGVLNLRAKSHALVEMPAGRDAHAAFRGLLQGARWLHDAPSTYPALLAPGQTAPTRRRTTRKAA
ncbi:hypothetical protein CP967_08470 [Streptomyces nitrosporeus]|uniref:PD-(D/E)XK endonuclease-like domain-containing protein n=1 Tax=Streptomyces nitrosporeus TaxID=28894 RepID=A0A5J6F848_9ACTN|nr:hypothetical protein [Streptomyces nitrosporeus]QEU71997.1 hypothetical protein CP967_08470 [Streptomyces nitrosporeus]GGY81393.1 hypothetical protein GCM10010327_10080 [Streptomyces nitrosporeus]